MRARARTQVKPQMLSNLMWALATLQVAPQPLLAALAAEAQRQLPAFKPQARPRQRSLGWPSCAGSRSPGSLAADTVCAARVQPAAMRVHGRMSGYIHLHEGLPACAPCAQHGAWQEA